MNQDKLKKLTKVNKSINTKETNVTSQDFETVSFANLDKTLHAWLSQFTWLSPSTILSAYFDWLIHLNHSPEKCLTIYDKSSHLFTQFLYYTMHSFGGHPCESCVKITEPNKRFQNELWNQFPFNVYSQFFLINEYLWNEATTNIRGASLHNQNIINFIVRQLLDMVAPSNYPITNPEVINATINQSGMNFINGFNNLIEDIKRHVNKQPPFGSKQFKVGKNVAVTPGKVIYRNHLIELIQYTPATQEVYAEPVLIVPAWIMKFYILDLSPNNSMVKYLVDHGHTVFMISWRNPESGDRNLGMEDYVNLGVLSAIDSITHIVPNQKIHAVGYCIGGTLLMIVAAFMAQKKDHRLKSITLFAAQVDFKDAGELLLFIDECQVSYLEDIMWERGYLDGSQMAGTFSMLHSIDLIWFKMVLDYQLGTRRPLNDLMAWDNDTTRLPYKMHSEYLRSLFLNNDLVEENYNINGLNLFLQDINIPIFAVSTSKDHVAPWKSVYKIHFFTDTDITFVLTNGGHNSGVVNEPNHIGHGYPHNYQIMKYKKGTKHIPPETWEQKALHHEGSWWPTWQIWLADCSGKKGLPPSLGNPKQGYKILCDAPGTYVLQK